MERIFYPWKGNNTLWKKTKNDLTNAAAGAEG
jgi:hypothetical protein